FECVGNVTRFFESKGEWGVRGVKEKYKVSTGTSLDLGTRNFVMESNFPSPSELAAKVRNKDGKLVGVDENIFKVDDSEQVPNVINVTDTLVGNEDASTPAQDALVHDDLAQVGTISAHADMSVSNVNESTSPRS
ncbi:hypothetical protein Tco_1149674, partial [Tanacetum coccineum]